MKKKKKLPFGSFTREGWQNLALMVLVVFYIAQFGLDLAWKNMCGELAIDYCSFWSAAKIANEQGYANVYNLDKMEEIQKTVFPRRYEVEGTFATVPTPYLPVFILPFQVISFLGPFQGHWLWIFINLAALIFYLRFFTKNTTGRTLETRLLLMVLLSLPVFLNFFYGQVNVWLTICVGEYIRNSMSGKSFQAGLWLGGLLIKPQYLILIGLAILIQRAMKTLAGLVVSATAIIGLSLLMAGTNGLLSLIQLWFGYTSGLPATGPEVMMNWRMLGLNLTPYIGKTIPWTIAGLGMVVTFIATLYLWRRPVKMDTPLFAIAVLGTFAATGAFAWHSHLSSALILIAPLIYLSQEKGILPNNILSAWVFIPPAFRFLVFILAILVQSRILPNNMSGMLNFLTAVSAFGFNIYFLFWAAARSGKPDFSSNRLTDEMIS